MLGCAVADLDLRPNPITLRCASGQSLDLLAQMTWAGNADAFVDATVEAFIFDRGSAVIAPEQFGATVGDQGLIALGLTVEQTAALCRTPGWGWCVFVTLTSGSRFEALRGQLEITKEHVYG